VRCRCGLKLAADEVQGGRGGALGVGARGDVVGGAMQDLEDQHRGPLDVDGREGTVGDPSVQQLGDPGGRGTLVADGPGPGGGTV
jgi:hypothetical protein